MVADSSLVSADFLLARACVTEASLGGPEVERALMVIAEKEEGLIVNAGVSRPDIHWVQQAYDVAGGLLDETVAIAPPQF